MPQPMIYGVLLFPCNYDIKIGLILLHDRYYLIVVNKIELLYMDCAMRGCRQIVRWPYKPQGNYYAVFFQVSRLLFIAEIDISENFGVRTRAQQSDRLRLSRTTIWIHKGTGLVVLTATSLTPGGNNCRFTHAHYIDEKRNNTFVYRHLIRPSILGLLIFCTALLVPSIDYFSQFPIKSIQLQMLHLALRTRTSIVQLANRVEMISNFILTSIHSPR